MFALEVCSQRVKKEQVGKDRTTGKRGKKEERKRELVARLKCFKAMVCV